MCPLTIGLLQVFSERGRVLSEFDPIGHRLIQGLGRENALLLESKTTKIENLASSLQELSDILLDFVFVVGIDLTFTEHMDMSHCLKSLLSQHSDSFSLVLRQASAVHSPLTALHEPVAGWVKDSHDFCFVFSMSKEGMEGPLNCIGPLLDDIQGL